MMAAEAQTKNAIAYKKKLQAEADQWMAKNQELMAHKAAAEKAQKEAQDAIAAERKERSILKHERIEREKIDKSEKAKAVAKLDLVNKMAQHEAKKAIRVKAQSLIGKTHHHSKSHSHKKAKVDSDELSEDENAEEGDPTVVNEPSESA